ncbi:MAG: holin family protein [Rickettsiales bacterium]
MSVVLPIVEIVGGLIDKLIPDKEEAAKAKERLKELDLKELELHLQARQMQADVNKTEATHKSIFVAGWRPFIGWVCGIAFFYHFVFQPMLVFIMAVQGVEVKLPQFDMSSLLTVLMGMLGLGTLRTAEKIKGVSK